MDTRENQLAKSDAASGYFRRALLVSVFFPLAAAFGQQTSPHLLDLSLEELGAVKVDSVFAASKFSEKVTDAPSSVSIVTRQEIQQFGWRTLAEIIRSVRGFDITYDRNYTYIGVRGFNRVGDYGSKTLLLVDGHRMNDLVFDSTFIGTEGFLDVDTIERVEFIRGPGSALYGGNAFFGVISITTRSGADVRGVEAVASYGSFDTRSGRLTFGKKFSNGLEFMLSGTDYASDGPARLYFPEFDTPENNHGIAYRADGDRAWNLFGSLSYHDFTLRGGYVSREKDVPTGSFGSRPNDLNNTLDDRGFIELAYAHTTENGWALSGRASYDIYHYQSYVEYPLEKGGKYVNNDSADARWWGFEAGASHEFFNRFRFSMGVEFRRSIDLKQANYDEKPRYVYADVTDEQEVFGAYVDGNFQITKWLKAVGGLRYDHYNSFGETVNPRFGLIVEPLKDTSLKLLYGEAFRAPNSYELAYNSLAFIGNPTLQPERIRTTELVAEHYFDAHWRAAASVFQNDIIALITSRMDAGGAATSINGGDARVRGTELEVEGKWGGGTLLRASYTRHLSEDSETGKELENSPRDSFRAQGAFPIFGEKLSAGLELLYQSDRFTARRDRTGDTWLVNATLLSRELRPGLEISASIYNLLDDHYRVPGGSEHKQDRLEQDGRTFRLKLSYRF